MALYLDDQTRPHLERIYKVVSDTDFVGKRIQGMLEADKQRLDDIGGCAHTPTTYTGTKTCCGKCGSFYEEGMGQTRNY